ncbi:MAG TPA: HU family DNA-binding protein [bacterium]|nr:HU family DNA-binding protein [bacterium]HOL46562.1 HU family DNA-binding protein [bacterium]HPQ17867.1 HU family DNA-binding protein [bacterium]
MTKKKVDFYNELRNFFPEFKLKEIKEMTDIFIDSLIELIKNNKKIIIPKFGVFEKKKYKAKKNFSPKKNIFFKTPEKEIIKFYNCSDFFKK